MIHLTCALRPEALPIIEHLELRHCHNGIFNTYVDRQGQISLTITGTGKVAAAAGVVHTFMLLNSGGSDIWLNIGTAGHAAYPIGQTMLANKITDQATGKVWYPQILFDSNIPATTLISLDHPSSSYTEGAMYDMEASGFYEIVSKTGTAELCHCLKVISDNQTFHLDQLDAAAVARLISASLCQINTVIDRLKAISKTLERNDSHDETYTAMTGLWRFTHAERIRLRALLHRWQLLSPVPVNLASFNACSNGRQVLKVMEVLLDRMPVQFDTGRS